MNKKELTGLVDDNGKPIHLGDLLYSEWDYAVVVCKDDDGYYGKLVCPDEHPCKNIPYALNGGKGYLIIKFKGDK